LLLNAHSDGFRARADPPAGDRLCALLQLLL